MRIMKIKFCDHCGHMMEDDCSIHLITFKSNEGPEKFEVCQSCYELILSNLKTQRSHIACEIVKEWKEDKNE